jgi:uncharacterized protein
MTSEEVIPSPALGPVESTERVATIDIIRGLALFGILAANMRGFAGPAITYFQPHLLWPALHDRIAQAFIDAFIQGKFITIFAFLFGAGFAIQLERAAQRGSRFNWIYTRRLLVLMLFGLIHGLLIWFGDILLIYGFVGFFLFFFRNRPDKTVLTWAVVLYFLPIALLTFAVIAGAPAPPRPDPQELQRIIEIFRNGRWIDIQQHRMGDAVRLNWAFGAIASPQLLGTFLFGLLAWRKRLFQPPVEWLPKYRRAMAWGLGFGIAGNVTEVAVRWIAHLPLFSLSPSALALGYLRSISVPALSLGYVCAVILLCQDPIWIARLQRYGAIGRTALSNYLLQSIVGTLLFYSYGLGLFARLGPALLIIPTIAIYAAEAMISPWWLSRWRFGPVEWLWRRATYGKV